MHRVFGLVLVAGLATSLMLHVGEPQQEERDSAATLSAAPSAPARYKTDVLKVTNRKRGAGDLRALRANQCLAKAAQRQAQAMADQRRMYHQDLGPVLSRCGMRMVGENVAYGYGSGKAVVDAWMRSPDHRANIMRGGFRLLGVGAVRSRGTWWVAQVFGTRA
ncbi:CAP domain-containing protein [Nocardioides sp. R-C-SC26]|uniref:CAP domain-containing protein n=1 Tax=Nocardioides sp. R-C-SC26 TaxID=2870414 RepID=UPI001E343CA7|nr:CAP domain-containing protein [Nocardioides sp. R-C-SC26]